MTPQSKPGQLPLALCALVLTTLAGCSASDSTPNLVNSQSDNLSGVWYYMITNPYETSFTDCTEDAAVLEGVPYHQGILVAPVCISPNSFEAIQNGGSVELLPATGRCGAVSASMGGLGGVIGEELAGELDFVSDAGVRSTHVFRGAMNGSALQVFESRRTFDGAFRGSCDLTPPLAVTITVR